MIWYIDKLRNMGTNRYIKGPSADLIQITRWNETIIEHSFNQPSFRRFHFNNIDDDDDQDYDDDNYYNLNFNNSLWYTIPFYQNVIFLSNMA